MGNWQWFNEGRTYFAGGYYGRPWTFTVQYSQKRYGSINIAAPFIGDIVVGYNTKYWLSQPNVSGIEQERFFIEWETWEEIDEREAELRRQDAKMKKRVEQIKVSDTSPSWLFVEGETWDSHS